MAGFTKLNNGNIEYIDHLGNKYNFPQSAIILKLVNEIKYVKLMISGYNQFYIYVEDIDNVATVDALFEMLSDIFATSTQAIAEEEPECDSRFLDTIGDGYGDIDFVGNYSGSPIKAIIKPQAGKTLFINRLVFFISDSGSVDAGMYGNNIVLTNGISIIVEKQNGTLIKKITADMPLKTNADYAKIGFEVSDISFGSGLNYVHGVLSFYKNGSPVKLNPDEQLAVVFNDDFTNLVSHTFRAGAYMK